MASSRKAGTSPRSYPSCRRPSSTPLLRAAAPTNQPPGSSKTPPSFAISVKICSTRRSRFNSRAAAFAARTALAWSELNMHVFHTYTGWNNRRGKIRAALHDSATTRGQSHRLHSGHSGDPETWESPDHPYGLGLQSGRAYRLGSRRGRQSSAGDHDGALRMPARRHDYRAQSVYHRRDGLVDHALGRLVPTALTGT